MDVHIKIDGLDQLIEKTSEIMDALKELQCKIDELNAIELEVHPKEL